MKLPALLHVGIVVADMEVAVEGHAAVGASGPFSAGAGAAGRA